MYSPTVLSCYWKNIDESLLQSQKDVFAKLGIPLKQVPTDGLHHGEWMDNVAKTSTDEIVVFADVDAFPLSRTAYEVAISSAKNGEIYGLAQVANHINPHDIYAGPMFMAFSRSTYDRLGQPSLCHSIDFDPAQLLTTIARQAGVPVTLVYPRTTLKPKWPLADIGIFGIGTFYGDNDFFHLFESRFPRNVEIFNAVAADVVRGQLDFSKYLKLVEVNQRPSWRKRLRRKNY